MKEDILKAISSLDEYFHIDRLKSDFFKAVALEYLDADPDTDFDAIESVNILVNDDGKEVTVTRDDIFTKRRKSTIKYYIPDIQRPIPEIELSMLYFDLHIKEKETDEHPKLLITMGYGAQLEIYWANGYEPEKKAKANER